MSFGFVILVSDSAGPPEVDETDIGNRDPLLEHTYKGLPKLRYVSFLYLINSGCLLALLIWLAVSRKAVMMSWSHKPAMLPCYSGIFTEVPRVNKKYVWVRLCFPMCGTDCIRPDSSSRPSRFLVWVAFETCPVWTLQIYLLALAVRPIFMPLVEVVLSPLYQLSLSESVTSKIPSLAPIIDCRNSLKE